MTLAEKLYTLPVDERLGFMKDIVDDARSGNTKLRQLLLNPAILRARWDEKHLFHRRCPRAYRTIGQAADAYCRRYWGASLRDVLYGKAQEPDCCEDEGRSGENVVTMLIKKTVATQYLEKHTEGLKKMNGWSQLTGYASSHVLNAPASKLPAVRPTP